MWLHIYIGRDDKQENAIHMPVANRYFVFLYLIFLSQQVLYFLLSTLVLTLYIDVVLSLSILTAININFPSTIIFTNDYDKIQCGAVNMAITPHAVLMILNHWNRTSKNSFREFHGGQSNELLHDDIPGIRYDHLNFKIWKRPKFAEKHGLHEYIDWRFLDNLIQSFF